MFCLLVGRVGYEVELISEFLAVCVEVVEIARHLHRRVLEVRHGDEERESLFLQDVDRDVVAVLVDDEEIGGRLEVVANQFVSCLHIFPYRGVRVVVLVGKEERVRPVGVDESDLIILVERVARLDRLSEVGSLGKWQEVHQRQHVAAVREQHSHCDYDRNGDNPVPVAVDEPEHHLVVGRDEYGHSQQDDVFSERLVVSQYDGIAEASAVADRIFDGNPQGDRRHDEHEESGHSRNPSSPFDPYEEVDAENGLHQGECDCREIEQVVGDGSHAQCPRIVPEFDDESDRVVSLGESREQECDGQHRPAYIDEHIFDDEPDAVSAFASAPGLFLDDGVLVGVLDGGGRRFLRFREFRRFWRFRRFREFRRFWGIVGFRGLRDILQLLFAIVIQLIDFLIIVRMLHWPRPS